MHKRSERFARECNKLEPEFEKALAEEGMSFSKKDVKMAQEFSVVIEKDKDGYYVASVPALRGCHTQAKSLDVLMKRIQEAIELCLEVEDPITAEFIGIQHVTVTL